MKAKNTQSLKDQIVELKQQVELNDSNYKYALELLKDSQTLLRIKEEMKHLKERLQILQMEVEKLNNVTSIKAANQ